MQLEIETLILNDGIILIDIVEIEFFQSIFTYLDMVHKNNHVAEIVVTL